MTENKVIRLSPDGLEGVGLSFWGNCDAEDVIKGKPVETGHNYFTDATGQLTAGVWECTAYTSQIESYPVDEFCLILSGQVVITDANDHAETFNAGDCFVIPKGLKCIWHMPDRLRKFYVILDASQLEQATG